MYYKYGVTYSIRHSSHRASLTISIHTYSLESSQVLAFAGQLNLHICNRSSGHARTLSQRFVLTTYASYSNGVRSPTENLGDMLAVVPLGEDVRRPVPSLQARRLR